MKLVLLIAILPIAFGSFENGKPLNENLEDKRQGRVFSLFSIVTFPNNECTFSSSSSSSASLSSGSKGLCQTSSECSSGSGVSSGTCAAGFGVCCQYKTSTCGSTVTKNASYIQSPSTLQASCEYSITPIQSDICQIRLDFVTFVTAVSVSATTAGACSGTDGDTLTITGTTSAVYSPICGTNTGQHIYIENNRLTSSNTKLTFTTTTPTVTSGRSWNIKVIQIECNNAGKAPADCFQYFTGASGTIDSFNYAATTRVMLQSQTYNVCVRQELGFCKIDYSTSDSSSSDGFQVGLGTTALIDTNCLAATATAYVIIQTGESEGTLFCGAYLSTKNLDVMSGIVRGTAQFNVGVLSSAKAQASDTVTTSGFRLSYNQVPCS